MIVTYNWLREFVDCDLPVAELSDLLTMLGLEVERVETVGAGMDDVVVAQVLEKNQHPNADKLSLCKVNNGAEILTIVCGAQNFKAGDKVALAQIGAVLPGEFKIKRSKIRGEESCGMLCSEKELGLAEESAGIMILSADLQLGMPVFSALGLKDTIFEIGLTPNRADCLSIIGIAREVAAKLGKKVKYPELRPVEGATAVTDITSVTIEAPELCPRYTARYVSGSKIGPSPQWMVNRLKAVGQRSINNVVDITNYVLMEYGHPLHAFDFKFLSKGKIVVRQAAEGEKFDTLDGQVRTLQSSDLTICDGDRAVALAGIMGGKNSEIADDTTDILIESAYFNPSAIRRTSKRLGLHTESSHRFERGTDVNILPIALDRAASLIVELAGGTLAKGVVDAYPQPVPERQVPVRVDRVNQVLGIKLSAADIKELFERLEFTVTKCDQGIMEVTVPSYRVDIEREIDLVEEVARLHGFENIPVTMPQARIFSETKSSYLTSAKTVKDLLVCQGLSEVINYSFFAPDAYDKILLAGDDYRRNTIQLLNPLSDEQSIMRTTLLPGLLETAARNASFRILNQRIFEMRRIYLPRHADEMPEEPPFVAGLLTGLRSAEGWNQAKTEVDFYDVKGILENIFAALDVSGYSFEVREPEPFYHPGKSAFIICNGDVIGSLGELHPTVQEAYGLEKPLFYFELNFEKLVECRREDHSVSAPSRFPDTYRDIALLVDDDVSAEAVVNCARKVKAAEIAQIEIFDLYKGSNIPAGQKSIAIRVRYSSKEKTLTDEEVNPVHQQVIQMLQQKLNASIR
ncbi:phenylalanyl-tRNA synthetase, beta subunit [Geotalea daltonii FRC-32]|uniref:Phenylalanine--tRNA ligase beta subunit n=1 Tax=Geotalea daltonii (strain DSM 22248 / JCM 15807 / FRC-32) TaxID=316067 RepID=B9M519_GEODF|nr:phenylalanine--tRNA ligase subunit beta [Geotalea daltonii]ACM21703.1 phenylalanyl-tRNA synthetase, beta subunit [Geotalea daltonii FRC-32]